MSEPPVLWRYDNFKDPVTTDEIEELVRIGGVAPGTFTWLAGGAQNETYPASWHLKIWRTHPELGQEPPRSLLRVQADEEHQGINAETLIWAEGENESRPLSQFSWRIEIGSDSPEQSDLPDPSDPSEKERVDVFISYSQKDRSAAEELETSLKRHGLSVWRDDRLLDSPEASFVETITQAHNACKKVVVLWSENSVGSVWVQGEAERARMAEKIVTVALQDLDILLPQIPLPFNVLPTLRADDIARDAKPLLRALGAEKIEGKPIFVFKTQVDLTKLPTTYATRLFGREEEMETLVEAWDGGATNVIAFDAMGGAGKTALTYHFVQNLKTTGWRGAHAVYAWSFYSQGSNADRQVDADEFFKCAIRFLAKDPEAKIPTDSREKGLALAKLLQKQRCLLVLDGLEPLQYAAGARGGAATQTVGGIKDPGVKALLQKLAEVNPGLCIVTTRIALREFDGNTGVQHAPLDRLPFRAGVDLLRSLGVEPSVPYFSHCLASREEVQQYLDATGKATSLDDALREAVAALPGNDQPGREEKTAMEPSRTHDLLAAVTALQGHALALTLVGNFIREQYNGDIRRFDDIPTLEDLAENAPERDPYRVMRAIEINLRRQIADQKMLDRPAESAAGRQLGLLYFLGFFDRPGETKLMDVVFGGDKDVLPDDVGAGLEPEERFHRRLFYGMYFVKQSQMVAALSNLARQGLISRVDEKVNWAQAEIDCHPLVREYFGEQLKEIAKETFREMHGRLYDHYRYDGLPEEFREPVAYAILCYKCSFPDGPLKKRLEQLKRQEITIDDAPNIPPAMFNAPEKIAEGEQLIDTPVWKEALNSFLPEDEKGMTPLFAAISHGCQAGREDETFNEVYWPRVARGNEAYAGKQLGLYGPELAALASFFIEPFGRPSSNLSDSDQSLALNLAGFRLRAIGRLVDAVEPMRIGSSIQAGNNDFKNAASGFGNLSELLLTIGRLEPDGDEGAVAAGRDAVTYADRSGDLFQRMNQRGKLGDTLFQAGKLSQNGPEVGGAAASGALARPSTDDRSQTAPLAEDAESLFREAEALQGDRQPTMPWLYGPQGFRYEELLLARGRAEEVAGRAEWTLEIYTQNNVKDLLSISLSNLSVAKAQLARTPSKLNLSHADFLPALRRANNDDELPRGLLTAAEISMAKYVSTGEDEASAANELAREFDQVLKEGEDMAVRGPMPLFLAEAKLLRAQWEICHPDAAKRNPHAAQAFRDEAGELIEKHQYGWRVPDLRVLDLEIAACETDTRRLEVTATEAIAVIEGQGWWGLMPRLTAMLEGCDEFAVDLVRLREKQAAYNTERDAHLKREEERVAELRKKESGGGGGNDSQVTDELVEMVFADDKAHPIIRQLLEANDIPADDLDGLPMDLKRQIVAAIVKQGS